MFKQFLQQIPGADFFMICSLAIFILFFLGVGIYLLSVDKKEMERMARLPFSGNSNESYS
jgi:hypothetical protein